MIPLRSSERSTAFSSSFVIFVILPALLVNLAVWSDQPVLQALNLARGAAALLFTGHPTRGIEAGLRAKPLANSAASPERYPYIAVKADQRRSACEAFPPRDIEVVVESALSLVVVVSALWNWRFRCRFPPLRFGVFRHWDFVFCGTSRRAALASAWASSTVLMRCHSFVGGARPTWK
jgi:hypothetical protein